MKTIIGIVIVLAAIGACNPPQSTTNPSADSTANPSTRDTSVRTQDTSVAPQRDTGMNK